MVKKTTDAVPPTPAAPTAPAGDLAPNPWPAVLSAMMSLANAMVAVARFPNQPVPVVLTARVETAQQALSAAVAAAAAGGSPSIDVPGGAPYDDAWIKSDFEQLNAALKTRFEQEAQVRADALREGFETIAADVKAMLEGLPDLIDQRIAAAAAQAADPA